MEREQLQDASESLRRAAAAVDDPDVEERIYAQSEQMADLATAERGPDQGRLDRHMNILRDIVQGTDGEVREHVQTALDAVRAYRETVGGV